MAYLELNNPARRVDGMGGGGGGRFLGGMGNPNYGTNSTKPTQQPKQPPTLGGSGSDYGLPVDISRGPGPKFKKPGISWMAPEESSPSAARGAYTPQAPRSLNKGGSYFTWEKSKHPEFNEPDIPGFREWEGEMWAPDRTYDEANIDPTEMIKSRYALIDEELGTDMSEAARRFGKTGGLMSGGGRGAGFLGTLGESERGAMRDKRQIGADLTYNAAQAEANRRAAAFEGEMGRGLSAHEGHQGRGFGAYGAGLDYDKWKYGADLGAAQREQNDATRNMEMMLSLYGR